MVVFLPVEFVALPELLFLEAELQPASEVLSHFIVKDPEQLTSVISSKLSPCRPQADYKWTNEWWTSFVDHVVKPYNYGTSIIVESAQSFPNTTVTKPVNSSKIQEDIPLRNLHPD
ncbi:hypothetical protein HDE_03643 [Halotydeus destructor]|nr:hypothetical protein HDE_03643 [Halotydeus destructor]